MNSIEACFTGRVTSDPESRLSQAGKPWLKFSAAVGEVRSNPILSGRRVRGSSCKAKRPNEARHAGADELGEASFFLAQSILDHANHIEETLQPDCREEPAS